MDDPKTTWSLLHERSACSNHTHSIAYVFHKVHTIVCLTIADINVINSLIVRLSTSIWRCHTSCPMALLSTVIFFVTFFTLTTISLVSLVGENEFPLLSRHRLRNLWLCRLSMSLRSGTPGAVVGQKCFFFYKSFFTKYIFTDSHPLFLHHIFHFS